MLLRDRERQGDVQVVVLVSQGLLRLDERLLWGLEGQVELLVRLAPRAGLAGCVQGRAGAGAESLSRRLLPRTQFQLGRDLLLVGKGSMCRADVLRVRPFLGRSRFILIIPSTTLASKKGDGEDE